MTRKLGILCAAAATLLVSAGRSFAQETKPAPGGAEPPHAAVLDAPRDARAQNRAEREVLGVKPDLRRADTTLEDLAERARYRHAQGEESAVAALAKMDRPTGATADAITRARHEGASQFARVARVMDRKGDRRDRESYADYQLQKDRERLERRDFPKDTGGVQLEIRPEERNELERQKKKETQGDSGTDLKYDRSTSDDKRESHDDSVRQRLEERQQARQDAKQDKQDSKKDAAADRAQDKADRNADRAQDRKDAKAEAKADAAVDKKSP